MIGKETKLTQLQARLKENNLEIARMYKGVLDATRKGEELDAEIAVVNGMTDHEVYLKYESQSKTPIYLDSDRNEREPTQEELYQESCNTCW